MTTVTSDDVEAGPPMTPLRAVTPIFLATRLGVLAAGYFALMAFGYQNDQPPIRLYASEVMNLPFRFDVGWYFDIATEGYTWSASDKGQQSVAFFPALPLAARWLGRVVRLRFIPAAMILTFAAAFGAFVYFFRLAREYLPAEQAAAAVSFLATYPFAIFYSVPYTESLFLLSVLGAWWHFGKRQYLRAGAWGLIAGLTRPNGALLSVALATMLFQCALESRQTRRLTAREGFVALAAAAMPGVGMLLFCLVLYRLTGNPFEWSVAHAAWGRTYTPIGLLIADWIHTPAFFPSNVGASAMVDFVTGLIVLIDLILAVPIYRRFGLAAAVFVPLCLLPPLLAGGLLSMGRLTSVVFPIFLWLAAVVPARHRATWFVVFAMGQALAAAMFFTWRPLY